MKNLGQMSREDLIKEILSNQEESFKYVEVDDLRAMVVDFRTNNFKRDLIMEITGKEVKPHVHYHGVPMPVSSEQGHGHGFL